MRMILFAGLFAVVASRALAGVNDGLVAYYNFNDTGKGLLADMSGHDHAGWVQGATAAADGVIGGAYHFRGINDYVLIGNLGKVPQGTIAFWMNADAVENHRNPFSTSFANWDDCIRFEEGAPSDFCVGVGPYHDPCGFLYMSNMQARTWYHVAFAWTETTYGGWLNGKKLFSGTQKGRINSDLRNVAVGNGYSRSPDRFWKGLVDELRIYNRALPDAEVATLANQTSARVAAQQIVAAAATPASRATIETAANAAQPATPQVATVRTAIQSDATAVESAGPAVLRIGFSNASNGDQDVTDFQTGETLFIRVSDVDLPARLDETKMQVSVSQKLDETRDLNIDVELKREGDAFTGSQSLAFFKPGVINVAVKGLNKRGVFLFRSSALRVHSASGGN